MDAEEIVKQIEKRTIVYMGRRLESLVKEVIVEKKIVDTGMLLKSVTFSPDTMELIIGAPYAIYVEFGRKAGGKYPPYSAIERWVRRKLKPKPSELEERTWAVMNKIKYKGIKGRYFVKQAIDELIQEFS